LTESISYIILLVFTSVRCQCLVWSMTRKAMSQESTVSRHMRENERVSLSEYEQMERLFQKP
jgi:hypothetical protein